MTRNAAAALLVLACLCRGASAAAAAPATPAGLLSFADALRASGESFRAVTEYLRFLHHYPEHPDASRAVEGLGRAYAIAGRWEEAIAAFRRLDALRGDRESRRLLGAALYRGGRYGEAARLLLGEGASPAETTLGTLAWLRAEGAEGPAPAGVRQELVRQYRELPRKSPATAGTLAALLPGAGHLYCDRPRDAAVSLALNGAFAWGTYEAARREQWALAAVLGLFELGWYSGNVVSAVNAAHKWNRREQGRFFHRWESDAVPRWTLAPSPRGWLAAVRWVW
ncbi:MAG: hypothetical protein Kow0092_19850 [Deferrisomatales bacterium]